jgi:exodeoxyribonuclease III
MGAKKITKKSSKKTGAKKKTTGSTKARSGRYLSWNVNGLRAVLGRGFVDFVLAERPEALCLQEIKANPDQVELNIPGYEAHWHSAEKKGYSGTLTLTRRPPLAVTRGPGVPDPEGRVLTCEFEDFFLVNVYTPNAAENLKRLDFRMQWDTPFLNYLKDLERRKPVVFCGDTNVAHKEIDLKNPKANRKNPGFTDEERAGFTRILEAGFVDTFREFNQEPDQYSWWSARFNSRAKNIGWRLDYFCLSIALRPRLKDGFILKDVMGSDHCPVGITLV